MSWDLLVFGGCHKLCGSMFSFIFQRAFAWSRADWVATLITRLLLLPFLQECMKSVLGQTAETGSSNSSESTKNWLKRSDPSMTWTLFRAGLWCWSRDQPSNLSLQGIEHAYKLKRQIGEMACTEHNGSLLSHLIWASWLELAYKEAVAIVFRALKNVPVVKDTRTAR